MKKNPEQISSPTHSERESLQEVTWTPTVLGDVQTTLAVVLIMSPWKAGLLNLRASTETVTKTLCANFEATIPAAVSMMAISLPPNSVLRAFV